MDHVELKLDSLDQLRSPVKEPSYDPAHVECQIVHLGLGGFHRAHMARYTHDLMELLADAHDWGIIGVGLLQSDRPMANALAPQDCLYSLIERDQRLETVTVVGSIRRFIFSGESSAELLAAIDRPLTRIVSLTVTENGYCLDSATKTLDFKHPLIADDLANPQIPRSVIGLIVEGLRRRRAAGRKPFTALSCDNIQQNGIVLREAVLAFASRVDEGLAAWIATVGRFPSTMVDRITPVTQPGDIAYLADRYGVADNAPVVCESFRQWVIEDDFADGRPPWDEVGAQFVTDVLPYELMKLRLLNASHLAVAGLAALAGYTFIHEAMRDDDVRRYMTALMDRETGPTLLPVPGINLVEYKASLIERFANPSIKDTVQRVNTDAPVNYLLDPIRDRLAAGQPIDLLALALAAWLRRVRGEDDKGNALIVNHPQAALLRVKAIEGGNDPRPLLGITAIFGDLGRDERLITAVGQALSSLYQDGAGETLGRTLSGENISLSG